MTRILAAFAAALLACAPAAAQNIAKTPAAGALGGTERIVAAQGSGCASGAPPCATVFVTPIQLGTYLASAFQARDADLDAVAALATTSFGRGLLTQADAAAVRATLGLGTLATQSGTFSGTSSGTNTGDQTSVTGNAGTATKLATARAINGVAFDGSAPITINAVDSTPRAALTGADFTGPVTINSFRQTGNSFLRIEGSGNATPAGATGPGFNIFQAGGTAYLEAYNYATSGYIPLRFNGSQIIFSASGGGPIKLLNLPVYANDSAAGSGGLVTDQVYKTSTGELRIKL